MYNLVNLKIPEDPGSTDGVYLDLIYYHKNETQQMFARLLILKSEESFCLLMEDNSKELCLNSGQSTQFGEIEAKIHIKAVNKDQLFSKLSKLNFLDIEDYTIYDIKKVSHRFWSNFPALSEETVKLNIVIDGKTEVKVSLN